MTAGHVARPAPGAVVRDRDGWAAGERTRMVYPCATVCTCGSHIGLAGRRAQWEHFPPVP
jgi:hypothetical protein